MNNAMHPGSEIKAIEGELLELTDAPMCRRFRLSLDESACSYTIRVDREPKGRGYTATANVGFRVSWSVRGRRMTGWKSYSAWFGKDEAKAYAFVASKLETMRGWAQKKMAAADVA